MAAYTQRSERRRFPRLLQIIGVLGCGTLVLTLPLRAVLTGALVYVVGICYRAIRMLINAKSRGRTEGL